MRLSHITGNRDLKNCVGILKLISLGTFKVIKMSLSWKELYIHFSIIFCALIIVFSCKDIYIFFSICQYDLFSVERESAKSVYSLREKYLQIISIVM